MRNGWKQTRALLAIVAGVALIECGGGGRSTGPNVALLNYISGVSAGTGFLGTVSRHSGSPPTPGAGPAAGMTGSFSVINGGSSQVTVTAGSAFSRIYLSVSGVDGYFQVDLTGPATSSGLLITVARGIRVSNFNLVVGVEDASGAAGASVTQNLSVTSVGAGQVQVSVQWDSTSDVDLHVIDPTGEEIYYANAVGANGTLDLDSNAGCSPLDGVNNENITFPKPAPHGTYTVRVDYWDSCTFGGTSYVVTVQREGAAPLTFQGSFTGPGDKGGPGSGTQITTFTFP